MDPLMVIGIVEGLVRLAGQLPTIIPAVNTIVTDVGEMFEGAEIEDKDTLLARIRTARAAVTGA